MKCFRNLSAIAGGLALACTLLASACSSPVSFDQDGRSAASSLSGSPSGDSSRVVYPPTAQGSTSAWFTQSNIYQIFPATFSPEGNLAGIESRMDYLADLGVKTIWLMPIFEAMNTHGYDATDYYAIDTAYGQVQDLKNLVDAAHLKDIRVVLDLVVNHTGTGISWFSSSNAANRHDDWYIWSNTDKGWDDPWNFNSNTNVFGATWMRDPYDWYDRDGNGNAHDDDYYYSVFGENGAGTMPDLNWKGARTAITDEVESIMRFWIDNAGVDGYRCDAARYLVENGPGQQADQDLTHEIWQNLRSRLSAYAPGAVLIAESPTETYSAMKKYYGSSDTPEFHSAFHFKYSYTLMDTVKNGWKQGNFWPDLFAIQGGLPPLAVDTLFLTNHDSFTGSRVATQLGGDQSKIKLAGSLYITLSGNPATYYGEEYGMQNTAGQSGDTAIRGPMDWNAIAAQKADAGSVLNHYRALYALRNTYDALRGGISYVADSNGQSGWSGYSSGGNHIAFVREYYGEKILVVHNLSSSPMNIRVNLASTQLAFDATMSVTPLMGGGSYPDLSAANRSYYDVGQLGGYCTRILYLGAVPSRYNGLTYDSARTAPWSGESGQHWTAAWFRGTPNNWGTTAMTQNADKTWTTTQTFGSGNPRFKISRYQDWSEAYPSADFPVPGAGTYVIVFNDQTKEITVTPTVQPPAAPSLSPAGGTWTLPLSGSPSVQFGCATSGVSYRYTIGTVDPTAGSGTEASFWTVPATVGTYKLNVVSVKDGLASTVTTGTYIVENGTGSGKLTITMKSNGSSQNVKFPGDFNSWNIGTTNSINVGANGTVSLSLDGVVTAGALAQGNSSGALELQVINVSGGSWSNYWSFANWTKVGCSAPDGKQITIPCAANRNVTLVIDVSTTTLTAVVQ